MIDLVIARPEALDYSAYAHINQLAPFGAGNPEPVFKIDKLRLVRCWTNGQDGGTLQVRLQYGGIQFKGSYKGGGPAAARFEVGSLVNVVFSLVPALQSKERGGQPDLWLQVMHMETATGA